jgi:hypothetical protein
MRHKTKLIEFVIILMAFFLILGCEPENVLEDDGIWVIGTGCWEEDTYKVESISNDEGETITVELSAFNTASNEDHRWKDSDCDVYVNIPAGMSMGLAGMDHEGSAYIPSGGQGKLTWDQYYGHNIPPMYDSFITTNDEDHEFSFKSTAPVLWSKCEEDDSVAGFQTSIDVSRKWNSSVQAQMNVSKMKIYLKWKKCE